MRTILDRQIAMISAKKNDLPEKPEERKTDDKKNNNNKTAANQEEAVR